MVNERSVNTGNGNQDCRLQEQGKSKLCLEEKLKKQTMEQYGRHREERQMEIRLTLHAEARMKERLGIKSKNEKQRMAELAYARGKFIEIQERERLGRLSKAIILEYKERLFVFSRSRVIACA